MWKLITIAIFLMSPILVFCQCNYPSASYEYSISTDSNIITVKVRNIASAIRVRNVSPPRSWKLIQFKFSIKWSLKSDILLDNSFAPAPFAIKSAGGNNRKGNFNFQSFNDSSYYSRKLSKRFISGEWSIIATIPYTGNLAGSDKFELVECGFDSTSDPVVSLVNKKGVLSNFSPLLLNNPTYKGCSIQRSFVVYPYETQRDLNVEIICNSVSTNATFRILNMEGVTVKLLQSELAEGINKITINVSELKEGFYMLKVINGKELNYAQTFQKK